MKIGVAKNKKKIFVSLYKKNIELHPLWLRERVNNQGLLDKNTGQRLYDPADLNHKLKIKKALIKKKLLNVEFTDGIESHYHIDELLEEINKNISNKKIFLWNSRIKNKPIFRFKSDMFNNREGYTFLEKFYKYGFSILKNTPAKKNFIIKFANLIGVVRPTNFGVLFDVKSVRKANDLAYTPHSLSAHTDNPYRKPIPGIQILHCVKNDSQGGHSTLTDGFAVAEYLKKKHKNFFKLLTSVKIRFTFVSKDTILENWGETIELNKNGSLKRVRLSPRLDYVPILKKDQLNQFYKARALFIKLCNSKKFMIQFKLEPGDMMIMDNYRTLHGRTAFNMNIGERHLQGCYIDHDSAESKMKYLKRKFNIYGQS
tara:strand:- start:2074 stop:3186 length:1113 start_codon:yes stop_codon:yes gene_type:complete